METVDGLRFINCCPFFGFVPNAVSPSTTSLTNIMSTPIGAALYNALNVSKNNPHVMKVPIVIQSIPDTMNRLLKAYAPCTQTKSLFHYV